MDPVLNAQLHLVTRDGKHDHHLFFYVEDIVMTHVNK